MTTSPERDSKNVRRISANRDGPYTVTGDVPLVRKTQVVSEYGEPLAWKTAVAIETGETYRLCRCGQSRTKPFCDGSHRTTGFDGTETAPTNTTVERQDIYAGGTHLVVKRDTALCMESGFCGTRLTNIQQMLKDTGEPAVRAAIIGMIERCPSGSFTYSIEPGEPDIEPDLPAQMALTIEITSDGPISGPLWVTGNIPIERSDGQPFETRNRVTLCNCGQSKVKPLCDGAHRKLGSRVIS